MKSQARTRKIKDASLVQLGRMFAEMRRAKRLSQERFGELVGIHPKYYAQIERGEKNVTFKTLEQILTHGHGLQLSSLFFGASQREKKEENSRMISLFHVLLKRGTRRERLALYAFLQVIAREPRSRGR